MYFEQFPICGHHWPDWLREIGNVTAKYFQNLVSQSLRGKETFSQDSFYLGMNLKNCVEIKVKLYHVFKSTGLQNTVRITCLRGVGLMPFFLLCCGSFITISMARLSIFGPQSSFYISAKRLGGVICFGKLFCEILINMFKITLVSLPMWFFKC